MLVWCIVSPRDAVCVCVVLYLGVQRVQLGARNAVRLARHFLLQITQTEWRLVPLSLTHTLLAEDLTREANCWLWFVYMPEVYIAGTASYTEEALLPPVTTDPPQKHCPQ